MSVYIFDFINIDDQPDYRVVHGDDYLIARNLFVSEVPDFKEILHVFVRLF
jgi:hypothetical protein